MSGYTVITVDARGMRCPWPALRLARAVRKAPAGSIVEMEADDPAAAGEIAALAEQNGWTFAATPPKFRVRT